jgi:hypothetical protein
MSADVTRDSLTWQLPTKDADENVTEFALNNPHGIDFALK